MTPEHALLWRQIKEKLGQAPRPQSADTQGKGKWQSPLRSQEGVAKSPKRGSSSGGPDLGFNLVGDGHALEDVEMWGGGEEAGRGAGREWQRGGMMVTEEEARALEEAVSKVRGRPGARAEQTAVLPIGNNCG